MNQEAWLKPDIEINTELRTKAKTNFENNFLKVMTNSVFGIKIKNVRDHRDIKLSNFDKIKTSWHQSLTKIQQSSYLSKIKRQTET